MPDEDGQTFTFVPFLAMRPPGPLGTGTDQTAQAGLLTTTLTYQALRGPSPGFAVRDPVSLTMPLRGPGHVLSLPPRMVARTEPPAGNHDFEPNYFPFLEFVDPDTSWRYSLYPNPWATETDAAARPLPWICLIVLTQAEIETIQNDNHIKAMQRLKDGRMVLNVPGSMLPDVANAWATAHVHISGTPSANGLRSDLEQNPSNYRARLFCYRQLQPATHYFALVVPTYKASLNAGSPPSATGFSTDVAWTASSADLLQLPVYYDFEFFTSEGGDFESLARALRGVVADGSRVGFRAVDARLMSGDTASATAGGSLPFFKREGALAPPGFQSSRERFSEVALPAGATSRLLQSLNSSLADEEDPGDGTDPLLTYPVFGRYYRNTAQVSFPTADQWPVRTGWVDEANVDVRQRVPAGFGTLIVRRNQDDLVRQCWYQAGEIRAVNELLRLNQLALQVGRILDKRHVRPLSNDRFALLTIPFHSHVATTDRGAGQSFARAFARSGLIAGTLTQAIKRKAHQRIGIQRLRPFLPWEQACKACFVRPTRPRKPVSLGSRAKKFGIALPSLDKAVPPLKAEVIPVKPIDLERYFRPRFDLAAHTLDRVRSRVKFNDGRSVPETLDPVIVGPRVDTPLYRKLADISHDYLLPGLEFLPADSLTLMEENRRFIESVLLGANQAMIDELVWNHFPVNKAATVFTRFWDPVSQDSPPDIKDIAQWIDALGSNKSGAGAPNLVLVLKGSLIRRYPESIAYVIKVPGKGRFWSDAAATAGESDAGLVHIDPVFRARVGLDVQFVGFPFSRDQVMGAARDGEYYVVLQENHELPRFGLDVGSVATRRAQEDRANGTGEAATGASADPTWDQAQAHLSANGYLNEFAWLDSSVATMTSARIASRTYQKPVRVAFHVSKLLPSGA